jgi:hypothetical protein
MAVAPPARIMRTSVSIAILRSATLPARSLAFLLACLEEFRCILDAQLYRESSAVLIYEFAKMNVGPSRVQIHYRGVDKV